MAGQARLSALFAIILATLGTRCLAKGAENPAVPDVGSGSAQPQSETALAAGLVRNEDGKPPMMEFRTLGRAHSAITGSVESMQKWRQGSGGPAGSSAEGGLVWLEEQLAGRRHQALEQTFDGAHSASSAAPQADAAGFGQKQGQQTVELLRSPAGAPPAGVSPRLGARIETLDASPAIRLPEPPSRDGAGATALLVTVLSLTLAATRKRS